MKIVKLGTGVLVQAMRSPVNVEAWLCANYSFEFRAGSFDGRFLLPNDAVVTMSSPSHGRRWLPARYLFSYEPRRPFWFRALELSSVGLIPVLCLWGLFLKARWNRAVRLRKLAKAAAAAPPTASGLVACLVAAPAPNHMMEEVPGAKAAPGKVVPDARDSECDRSTGRLGIDEGSRLHTCAQLR